MIYHTQQSCSFKPKINKNSKKIADQRNRFFEEDMVADEHSSALNSFKPDQFLHLYDDAMKRVERHSKIYSMCIDSEWTFKPDLLKTKHKYSGKKLSHQKSSLLEKNMIEKFNNENFDPVTGQPLYHPRIWRPPDKKHHRSSKSIGNLLYSSSQLYKEKKDKQRAEYEQKIEDQLNTKYWKKSSEMLLEQMKYKRFLTLFQMLDSNGDGLISAQKIDISTLSPDVLEIMTPLFWEMEELGQTLDWEEFIDASKRLYNSFIDLKSRGIIKEVNEKWKVKFDY